jgi:class 3 adenylate cyclase/pimeloyl-ACP methyl ester carboxylesterase
MDIAGWLLRLGLGRYAATFAEHEITPEALPYLTDADLRELGLPIGPRKVVLAAIAALGKSGTAAESERIPRHASGRRPEAERRQLTVMFVDLVGSTTLSGRLDPEEMREVIRSYQNAVAAEITHFDGHVAKFMGDGVLAYFGWPRAHEDDAERAVRTGLRVADAVAKLSAAGAFLSVRIGIATGLAVVGDLIGTGAAQEDAVVGETPNLAARLQALAAPGAVLVAEGTRQLLGELFNLEDLGTHVLHGFPEPRRAWRVIGEGRARGRFEALHGAGLTPLVGREHELALLIDHWASAREGEGQVVLLTGEPGIGKSRLTEALCERLQNEHCALLRLYCSPYHTGTALHPFISELEHAAGLQRGDSAETKLDKLEVVIAGRAEKASAVAPLFGALFSIAAGERYAPLNLTAQQRKERTLDALLKRFDVLAGDQPVLLVFEDLHWIDPTSLELLGLLIDRIPDLPLLAIFTFRPEFTPPWSGRAPVTMLSLNRLSRRHAADLVNQASGAKALPHDILDQIVSRGDGVPLFIEELTKSVLESSLPGDARAPFAARGTREPPVIPTTLHDSLMARLDRLGPVKEVAQIAACIGREFSHELLAAVSSLADDDLCDALDRLASSGLVYRGAPAAEFHSFRHALVHEAAYRSLLRSKRQQLHSCIAGIVEDRFPNIGEMQPEWLARHFTEAGLAGPSSKYSLRAGQHAKDAYANREAVVHLHRCLESIALLPVGQLDDQLEQRRLEALVLLGDLASVAGDIDQANQYYGQALELPASADVRRRIGNKLHRRGVTLRDGARITFYEHGGGTPTLLFLAPLAYGLAAFQPIVEQLSQDFQIVTVDPRGSGASDPLIRPYPLSEHAKDTRSVIAALDGGSLVGVGISRSANVLLRLAHAEPRLFDKLVTIGCPPSDTGPPFFSEDYMKRTKEMFERGDIEGIVRFHTSLVLSEPETRQLRELFVQNRLQVPYETTLSFFDRDSTVDVTSILSEITVPTLVTHGCEDRLVAFHAAEYLSARLPNAQLYPFHARGHLLLFTATDEFCEVLRRFVRSGTTDQPARSRRSWVNQDLQNFR